MTHSNVGLADILMGCVYLIGAMCLFGCFCAVLLWADEYVTRRQTPRHLDPADPLVQERAVNQARIPRQRQP